MIAGLAGLFLLALGGTWLFLAAYSRGYRDGLDAGQPDAPRCRVPLCDHAAVPGVVVCGEHWDTTVTF